VSCKLLIRAPVPRVRAVSPKSPALPAAPSLNLALFLRHAFSKPTTRQDLRQLHMLSDDVMVMDPATMEKIERARAHDVSMTLIPTVTSPAQKAFREKHFSISNETCNLGASMVVMCSRPGEVCTPLTLPYNPVLDGDNVDAACMAVPINWLKASGPDPALAPSSKLWTRAEYGRDVRTI